MRSRATVLMLASYRKSRFCPAISSLAVWKYCRFFLYISSYISQKYMHSLPLQNEPFLKRILL